MTPNAVDQPDIEERWLGLDPVFIMGRQRTGTSIMWRALRTVDFLGFPEGHLWFDLVESFARFRNHAYRESVRQEIFTLGSDRNRLLEKRFALMMDQFHRDLLGPNLVRWVDKSPGVRSALLAPMLADLFPRAQFIFMIRNPITTVNSAVHYVPRNQSHTQDTVLAEKKPLHTYRRICEHWVRVMKIWRQVRPLLTGRYIEVAQEHIVETPGKVAEQLAQFLGVSSFTKSIVDVFCTRRENTAFPNRDVKDFFYPVDWTDEQKMVLAEVCRDEMAFWGYPLNFQHPSGPNLSAADKSAIESMNMSEYYQWMEHQTELIYRRELAECKETLARIQQGRVMRALNTMTRFMQRLGIS